MERPVDLASRDRNNVSKLQIRQCQLCSLLNSAALKRQWYAIHARSKGISKQRAFPKEVLETR